MAVKPSSAVQAGWVEVQAPAKVNLTLHVTGQRADGYHLLDSLVVFATFGDIVRAQAASETTLSITGPRAGQIPAGGANSVLSAARFTGKTARFELEKHLPVAAGIGGGTSDAAAALRALAELYGIAAPTPRDTLPLGADVPVCMVPCAQRMRDIGADLAAVEGLPALWAVLVNPGYPISTGAIFSALRSKTNGAMPEDIPRDLSARDFCAWLALQRNDLEPAALEVAPELAQVFDGLRATDPLLARMSGSGATCFGLYPDEASALGAGHRLAKAHPKWWVEPTLLK